MESRTWKIQCFAAVADQAGTNLIELELPADALTAAELKQAAAERHPKAGSLIATCFVARNRAYAREEDTVMPEDELAFIPPVSGGETGARYTDPGGRFCITYDHIDIEQVAGMVRHPDHGAELLFVGTTREHTYGQKTVMLEYEAYIPMALQTLAQIGEEISAKWNGAFCAITHRLGQVAVGEASVVIAVSSPHRAACYEASRYAIDRLKQIVPIWKKEIWEDGSEWKGAQTGPWDPTAAPIQGEST
ncbi:molybdopterin converting factor [Xylanibacillus composti]|uniref:molybdenum cofactor biosynthesis protein n=1 Tax=Xylanibacillus composti TaxID=1572762 RepID=UPI001BCE8269|nr:molybdenum cofactor biosynthesis protein MoaE [Xylanibacillus composti]MDT9724763.1 molybdopterin converting factor [Xylanibacillus composti]